MYAKSIWAALLLLAILAVSGCPRNPEGDTTVINPPAGDTTIVNKTDTTTTTPPSAIAPDGTTATATNPDGTPVTPATPPTEPPKEGDVATPPVEGEVTGDHTVVVFETTKGNIEMMVHPDCAPSGAAHFLELVNDGFYNGAPWFRVMDGFVAQAGVAADPAMNKKWEGKTLQDEPVVKGNVTGTVAFGKTGAPNSRGTHIFINLADNTRSLDPQGFSAFAEVTSGMDVAQKLTRLVFENQMALAAEGGMALFKQQFPDADYITKAYVK